MGAACTLCATALGSEILVCIAHTGQSHISEPWSLCNLRQHLYRGNEMMLLVTAYVWQEDDGKILRH
jgi:hypothetical protein